MYSTGVLMLNQLYGSGGGGGGENACLLCIYRFMVLVLCLGCFSTASKVLQPIIPEIAMGVWYLWNLDCRFLLQQVNRCSTVLYLVNNHRQFVLFLRRVAL